MTTDRGRGSAGTSGLVFAAVFFALPVSPAAAVQVAVDFVGVVQTVAGAAPGSPAVGSTFSGRLAYETEQAAVTHPVFNNAVYTVTDPSAVLSILLAQSTFGADPAAEAMTISVTIDRAISPFDGATPVPPEFPFALLAGPVRASSTDNRDVGEKPYAVTLEYIGVAGDFGAIPEPQAGLEEALRLPNPSERIARQLRGALIRIDGENYSVVGTVTNAVPEPATGLLLAAALTVLASQRRRLSDR